MLTIQPESLAKHNEMDAWHAQKMLNLETRNGGYYIDNNIFYIHNKSCYKFKRIKTQDLKWYLGKQDDI
jgi:hypothetical protein